MKLLPILALLAALGTAPAAAQTDTQVGAQAKVDAQADALATLLDRAASLEPLETVIVARHGEIVAERGYGGNSVDRPTNIKSASKTVVAALVGIAIDKGLLGGVDQPIAPILADMLPDDPDTRIARITIGNLLTMQAGLGPTSGPNYGRWVASRNWVRAALAEPFAADPGGPMLYSTGSSHLLSAILTRVTGQSSLETARAWLGPIEGFTIGGWSRDPQGIYVGGNEMAMSPRSLLAFGEMFRTGGLAPDGTRILSEEWIAEAWTARTNSRFTRDGYGYGWFPRRIGGADVKFAWGYGGQMLYIVPELGLTVTMTSDEFSPAASTGHRDDLHALLAEIIAVTQAAPVNVGTNGDISSPD